MRDRLTLLAIFAAFVLAAGSVDAASGKAPLMGFNDDAQAHIDYAGLASQTGATSAVIPVAWDADPARLALADAAVAEMLSEGQRPIVSLWGSREPDIGAYAAQFAATHARWPEAILAVWNEPNHPAFGNLSPAFMAELTKAAVAAAPNADVIGPAVVSSPVRGEYLDQLYSLLPRGLVGVGVHFYPQGGEGAVEKLAKTVRRAKRWGKVWVTEVGFMRVFYGDEAPRLSAEAWTALAALPYVKAVIFHRLALPEVPSEWESYGQLDILTNPDLRKALRKAMR